MIDVYGHKEQRRCNESLRLIGGRSPGSRDSRRPRHLPRPRRRKNSSSSTAPKKSTRATSRPRKTSARCKGLAREISTFPSETAQQPKHRLCTLLNPEHADNRREHSQGASRPAKPVQYTPLPLLTTSVTTSRKAW